MGTTINVDPSALVSTASAIETYAADYKKYYEQLITEVENMATNWSGEDNVSFTNTIKNYETNFQSMYQLLTEYVAFLKDSANKYSVAQSEIASAAKNL